MLQPLTALTSKYSSKPSFPASRPIPECLYPPNGASGAKPAPLISTIPDLSFLATLFAFSWSWVWIKFNNPYGVSFVIAIANDTPYGLLNFIQTQDQEKANRVARKLRSGMVDINGAGLAPDAPFGGYKHSGIGREAGKLGLEEYLEVKAVSGWNE